MKKHLKPKSNLAPPSFEQDIAGLIIKVQQQLVFLEKKIDALISRIPDRPFEKRDQPKYFQRPGQFQHHSEARQANGYRERTLHKAICADCNKGCEVPFKPSGDRPVYCKECFSKRKGAGGSFAKSNDNRPAEARPIPERHFDKRRSGENRKFSAKKRQVSKKRKKHS